MRWTTCTLRHCFLLSLVLPCAAQPAPTAAGRDERGNQARAPRAAPRVQPKVHAGDGWAVAAPGNWTVFPNAPPPSALYLVGDARDGVPFLDGTLSVIKAGLQVQRFPGDGTTVEQRVEMDLKEVKESGDFQVLKGPDVEEVTLADGTAAFLLRAEFVRLQNGRLSINQKLYCSDAEGRHLVATGFITCGRAGGSSVRAIRLPEFVAAHVTSLVLDPEKLDEKKVKPAYQALDWNAQAAIAETDRGNELLEAKNYGAATKAFRKAIALCLHLPAAHNGLAWSLLHSGGADGGAAGGDKAEPGGKGDGLAEALREAKTAVEQTEEQDFSALDTLALAYQRAGDKPKALDAARKALALQPRHPALQRRLRSIEAGR
jgi:hypothetical protein